MKTALFRAGWIEITLLCVMLAVTSLRYLAATP